MRRETNRLNQADDRRWPQGRIAILPLFAAAALGAAAGPAAAAPLPLTDVLFDQLKGGVVLQVPGPLNPVVKYFDRPNRIVVDLPEVLLSGPQRTIPVGRDGIVQVRVAQFQKEPAVVRVVFDVAPGTRLPDTVRAGDSLPLQISSDGQDRYLLSLAGIPLLVGAVPHASVPPASLPALPAPRAGTPAQLSSLEFRAGEVIVTGTLPLAPPVINPSIDGRQITATFNGLIAPQGLSELPVSSAAVRSVRVIALPGATQISLELANPAGYTFRQEAGGRTIRLVPGPRQAGSPPLPPPLPSSLAELQSVATRNQNGRTDVVLRADKPLQYRISRLAFPERVVVDIAGTVLGKPMGPLVTNSNPLTRVTLTQATADSVRVTLDVTTFSQFESALSSDGRELRVGLLHLAQPAPQGARLITLDAGHGGIDPGALGPRGATEAQVNMAVTEQLRQILAEMGHTVLLTRATDVEVLLQPRVDVANQNSANILVSIHANSSSNPSAHGVETYYKWQHSLPLARAIHKQLVTQLGSPDRGVRRANFYVVNHTTMPAVLVEIGYISHPSEESKLTTPEYQRAVAQAIADGIKDFFAGAQQ